MKLRVLTFFAILIAPSASLAQESGDCDALTRQIVVLARSKSGVKTDIEKHSRLLQLACEEEYIHCGFPHCTPPEPTKPAQTFAKDPLAWIRRPLECEELLDQFQARYAPLGPIDQLPQEKQLEIDRALEIVCSERFAHCEFSGCKKFEVPEPKPEDKVVTSRVDAEKALKKAIKRNKQLQASLIDARIKEESTRRVSWTRFSVPTSKSKVENEREEEKPLKRKRRRFRTPAGLRSQSDRNNLN